MIAGIDVSAVQGVLDWSRVDPDVKFVLHRCGVGNDHPVKDGCFERNLSGANDSGRAVGAYHFAYPLPVVPNHEDRAPVAQAEAHFDASGGLGAFYGELPPFLDLEWPEPQSWPKWGCTAEQIKAWAFAYLARMDQMVGRTAGLYIYPDFAHHLGDLSRFADRPLWLASYGAKPISLAPWSKPSIWQNSGGGGRLYNGMPVDTNIIDSDDELTGLLG